MSDKLNKVKEIIKKNIEDAKCGIFFTRNIVGDPTWVIYLDTDNGIEVDICYKYEYFEIFGLTEDEQKEIKNFYYIIKDYDKFDEFGFFNPFSSFSNDDDNEEEEDLDFVQPHKKAFINLEVCKMREATQKEREGIKQYIDSIAESCEDVISRQAAIDAFWKLDIELRPSAIDAILNMINDIPSVTQKPKTGHWIKTVGENGVTSAVRCSECGFEDNRYMLFKYCPNCGVKMTESEDKE